MFTDDFVIIKELFVIIIFLNLLILGEKESEQGKGRETEVERDNPKQALH